MKKEVIQAVVVLVFCALFRGSWAQCFSQNDTVNNNNDIERAVNRLVNGSHQFGLDLFRLLYEEHNHISSGLFFSPFSVWSALAVTLMGAKGQTEQEISNVLGVRELDKIVIARAYNYLHYREQSGSNSSSTYRLANKLFFQMNASLRQCLLEYFPTYITRVDFRADPEGSRQFINQWVEDQTNNKIKDLLPPFSVNPTTNFVIANAVYFKGTWLKQFDTKNNRKARFLTGPGQQKVVDMMFTTDVFLYGISEVLRCTAVELPYSGQELSMVILLPHQSNSSLDNLIRLITPSRLQELSNSMYPHQVVLYLPKFHIENDFDLAGTLQHLGLRDIFNPVFADLSGFTGYRDITVDAVRHKTYVDVNEEGTEAAAATGILATRISKPDGPTLFKANHPFLFFIRNNRLNLIVFMGTVNSPQNQ
ncbi:serpin B3-like [Limulus polyphemus]|uniref:Serpin B3-like n=1 Tax=Limulus polyphemus TaxID=6850 RepID=A0ABM1BDK8_LIMPO|nr:serpin B3-like [Limulus polyphemus]